MEDLQGLSREDLFSTVVTALQNVSDETEKAALANDMFGKSGQDLLPLFNMTEEELAGLMDECEEYGMVMSDDAVKASAAFQDSLTKLKATFGGLKNSVTGEMLPALSMIMDGLSDLIAGNENAQDIFALFQGLTCRGQGRVGIADDGFRHRAPTGKAFQVVGRGIAPECGSRTAHNDKT